MNCFMDALLLVAWLCIFMSSTVQTYTVNISHEVSDNRKILVTWYKDGSFSHDTILHCTQNDLMHFDSYELTTSYEITLSWDINGEKYSSRLFIAFGGGYALGNKTKICHWHLKMDGVYYSEDNFHEKLYATWTSLQQKVYEIRVVYKNWDGRKLHITWNHDRHYHDESALEENSPYATIRFESYSETTVYDISVKWDVDGVKYESKFFPVFSRTNVAHHEDTFIYRWYLKERGVYFVKDDTHHEELYKTWSDIRKYYEIRIIYEPWDEGELNITWNRDGQFLQRSILSSNSNVASVSFEACEDSTFYEISLRWKLSRVRYETKLFPVFSSAYAAVYPYTNIYFWYIKNAGVYFGKEESQQLRYRLSSLTVRPIGHP